MAFPGSSFGQESLSTQVTNPLSLTQSESGGQPGLLPPQSPKIAAPGSLSLVFVDSGVKDAEMLLAHSSPGTQVFYLNAIEDAVSQITRTLLNYQEVSAVHILSHGNAGGLQFAQGSLTANNLNQYTAQIKSWSQALSTNADILLYGCDVAGGSAGESFIRQLGQLSQADIAASTNLTGAGGDWILEASTGTIESRLISDETGRSQYRYSLDSGIQLLSNSNSTLASDAVGGDLGDRSVSSDGNFIVFSSTASNLVTGDTNGKRDVFLYDRSNNKITLVSHAAAALTQPSNGESLNASISADGNFVVFTSTGNNLTTDTKTGSSTDVFRWNRATGAIDLISKTGTTVGNGDSTTAVISRDGSTVAFLSLATNLATNTAGTAITDDNNSRDAFVWSSGILKTMSLDRSGNVVADKGVGNNLDISADGRFVVFNSLSQMSSPDTNFQNDIYVYDRTENTLDVVSLNSLGNAAGASTNVIPQVNFSGNILRILLTSNTRLVSDDINSSEDVYVAERDLSDSANPFVLRLVSRISDAANANNGKSGDNSSTNAVLSGNGQYVAFMSSATNLVAGDTNASQDVFLYDLDATDPSTATRLVSRNSSAGALGDGNSGSRISVSDDGSVVAFTSAATNLVGGVVANDTNAGEDLFAYNSSNDSLTLVTRKKDTTTTATLPTLGQFEQRSIRIVTNGTSKTIVYTNNATDLVDKDTNDTNDIFSFDLTTPANTLITKIQGGQASATGIGSSNVTKVGSVSQDGRYVVFVSDVNSFVAGDRNSAQDIFLRDTTLAATDPNALKLVSRTATGSGNQSSSQPFISADGKYIVFTSAATDLVTGDTNSQQDVFLYEVSTGSITLVSRTTAAQGDNASGSASVAVNATGEVYVTFLSRSSNLGASGSGINNVFVWKKSDQSVTLVSKASATAGGNLDSSTPIISTDGKYIAFTSNASNLTSANFTGTDNNNASDVFLYDIAAGALNLVSQRANTIGNSSSFNPIISDTNGVVAFESQASNLTAITDTNGSIDVFRYSATSGVSLVSVNAAGNAAGTVAPGGAGSTGASISADGNTIAFTSDSSNLSATTDSNGKTDVFVRNITTNTTTLISRSGTTSTQSANGPSDNAVLSADGQLIAFTSTATDLSAQDTTSTRDVFISSIATPSAKLISTGTAGIGNSDSPLAILSRDGGTIVFESNASNLVTADLNSDTDIFSRPTRPVVSFKVVDAAASEGITDTGTYELTRTDTAGSLQVKLKLSDLAPLTDAIAADITFTADQGATVSIAAGIVTITMPDGVSKVILTLTALQDNLTEGSENAILTLQADATYTLDPVLTTGTVVIAPNGTVVTNTNDSGAGSLRQAIANARLTPGADTITFALTNPTQKTITLLTPLEDLNGNITLDGGTSGVILSGASAGANANGLRLTGDNNVVKGITVTGFTGNGILVEGDNNTIGGTTAGNGNSINTNKLGVYVKSGTGNQILGNSITNNTDLGIDVDPIGISATDPLTLTSANATGTGATINGTLTGAAGTYRIEFFSNPTTDTVSRTEGSVYLGFQDVTITGTSAPIVFTSTIAGLAGKYISATVTDAAKNTSEFVKDILVVTPLPTINLTTAEDATGVNEGNTGTTDYKFTVKLSQAVTADTVFKYRTVAGTGATGAIADTDFVGVANGTVTVLAGSDTATITVKVKGDTRFEANKTFGVELFEIDTAVYAAGTLQANGIIKNDDLRPTISFESATVSAAEGQTSPNNQMPFVVKLSNESDEAVSVTYQTLDGTGTTGAISTGTGKDFTALAATVLTFNPGETSKTVNVELLADTIDEPAETFSLRLSAPTNATLTGGATTLDATGTIAPDEQPYTFSVTANNATVVEGAAGATTIVKFTVTLDRDPQEDLSIAYSTIDGSAIAGTDFDNAGGTLTFTKNGSRTQTIDVIVKGNNVFDGNRDFALQLFDPTVGRAVIDSTKGSATTVIQDDDLPTLSFKVGSTGDIRRVEGAAGTTSTAEITVELSAVSTQDVTVEFTTLDGTGANAATVADNDYIPRTTAGQKITIRKGQKSATASFTVVGDNKIEQDETFFVKLSNPVGATILGSDTQAVIIEDDDALINNQPKVSIAAVNASQLEGATGTTKSYTFSVTLDKAPEAGKPVTVNVSTVNGTGTTGATSADNDFVAKTQQFTFNPGDALTQTFTVQVNGDSKVESSETFSVALSGPTNATLLTSTATATIQDDDTPVGTKPVISITPATLSQAEGNSGTKAFTFTIQLDRAPAVGETVTVDVVTVDGTGTNGAISTGTGADFTAKTQTFTFTSTGALTQNFTVLANGDTQIEANETFTVELRNVVGATTTSNIATATIQDDDSPIVTQPRITVTPVSKNEGNSGTTAFTFRIALDKAPAAGQTVTLDVATVDGVGSSGAISTGSNADFTAKTQTFTFASNGALTQDFTVLVNGDNQLEANETFSIALRNIVGATAEASTIIGTINNDDSLNTGGTNNISIDSLNDILWRNPVTGETFLWQTDLGPTTRASIIPNDYLASVWRYGGTADFNKDGNTDVLWHNIQTGEVIIWKTNGNAIEAFVNPTFNQLGNNFLVPAEWHIEDISDYTGDNKADIFWRNYQTNQVAVWEMNGFDYVSSKYVSQPISLDWKVEAIADFTGAGSKSLFWRNQKTGATALWKIAGEQWLNGGWTGGIDLKLTVDQGWKVVGTGDMNGDRTSDVLWQNTGSGDAVVWYMGRSGFIRGEFLPKPTNGFTIKGAADFNLDGVTDLLLQNPLTRQNQIWYLQQTSTGIAYGSSATLPNADPGAQFLGISTASGSTVPQLIWRNTVNRNFITWQISNSPANTSTRYSSLSDPDIQILWTGDLDKTGKAQVLTRNQRNGIIEIGTLSNGIYNKTANLLPLDQNWIYRGIGDVDADGVKDIFWQNRETGKLEIWKMGGTGYAKVLAPQIIPGAYWVIDQVADFDGDGQADVFWRNTQNQATAIWLMSGATIKDNASLANVPFDWQVIKVADFDRNGTADFLWRNSQTGAVVTWLLDGKTLKASYSLPTVNDASWNIKTVADFDRDGNPDVLWYNSRTKQTVFWKMNSGQYSSGVLLPNVPSSSWDLVGTRDFNADGSLDLLWFDKATGTPTIWYLNDLKYGSSVTLPNLPNGNFQVVGLDDFNQVPA